MVEMRHQTPHDFVGETDFEIRQIELRDRLAELVRGRAQAYLDGATAKAMNGLTSKIQAVESEIVAIDDAAHLAGKIKRESAEHRDAERRAELRQELETARVKRNRHVRAVEKSTRSLCMALEAVASIDESMRQIARGLGRKPHATASEVERRISRRIARLLQTTGSERAPRYGVMAWYSAGRDDGDSWAKAEDRHIERHLASLVETIADEGQKPDRRRGPRPEKPITTTSPPSIPGKN